QTAAEAVNQNASGLVPLVLATIHQNGITKLVGQLLQLRLKRHPRCLPGDHQHGLLQLLEWQSCQLASQSLTRRLDQFLNFWLGNELRASHCIHRGSPSWGVGVPARSTKDPLDKVTQRSDFVQLRARSPPLDLDAVRRLVVVIDHENVVPDVHYWDSDVPAAKQKLGHREELARPSECVGFSAIYAAEMSLSVTGSRNTTRPIPFRRS